MTSFKLPRQARLRSSADFERIYALRQRASDGRMLVVGARNPGGQTRAGYSVSRKHGNSVQRHRLKRLLREAFRLIRPELPPGLDLIVIPHQNVTATVSEYQESLRRLVRKLERRVESGESRDEGVNG